MYDRSLRRIPDDAKRALGVAALIERNELGRRTIGIMLESAAAAESTQRFVCSDAVFRCFL